MKIVNNHHILSLIHFPEAFENKSSFLLIV